MKPKLVLAAVLVAAAVPVLAHHSFAAEYDDKKPVTLKGVVTKVEWMNPHSHFFMDVTDDKGNTAEQELRIRVGAAS